jgi:hypothetical protein
VDIENLIKAIHDHQINGFNKHGAVRCERNSSSQFKALLQIGTMIEMGLELELVFEVGRCKWIELD